MQGSLDGWHQQKAKWLCICKYQLGILNYPTAELFIMVKIGGELALNVIVQEEPGQSDVDNTLC